VYYHNGMFRVRIVNVAILASGWIFTNNVRVVADGISEKKV